MCPASNLTVHKLDGFTLNAFADQSIALVFSHDVFVHFSSLQVYSYLVEIRRVLEDRGIGLLSFFDFVTHFQWFKELAVDLWEGGDCLRTCDTIS